LTQTKQFRLWFNDFGWQQIVGMNMKNLNAVFAGLWLGTVFASGAALDSVTYRVNLGAQIAVKNFLPGTDTVLVAGNWDNWAVTNKMFPSSSDANIYVLTLTKGQTNGGSPNYKFVINPKGTSSGSSLVWESLGTNRWFNLSTGTTNLPTASFNEQPLPDVPAFVSGADFSLLTFFENRGKAYKSGGQTQDALAIMKSSGLNCVRLRLFTSSAAQAQADPYDYTNNLDYTLPLAVRVKNAGLQLVLDFHYSDTWADPSRQAKPAAWTNLTFTQLLQQMHDYNSNCIALFKGAGAMPDYVQVGNEITGGLLWPDGAVPGTNATVQWSQLGQLMKAAIKGIVDASGANPPKIIVHIDRGGDWNTTEWFFDNLNSQGVPYDIIGESYYPYWHGPLSGLANCLTNAARRYVKPVMVMETGFPWTNSYWTTNIYGIPGTTNGQVQFLVALAQTVKNVPGLLGTGIFWWGAEYQQTKGVNEAGFNTASFFDSDGNVLPVADAVGQLAASLMLNPSLTGLNLTLRWPLSGAGMTLTTATNLTPPSAWLRVTNAAQNTGTTFSVNLPIGSSGCCFYRLQSN
jgi:arabinogalactan endo-1,4-beta-galactosidase